MSLEDCRARFSKACFFYVDSKLLRVPAVFGDVGKLVDKVADSRVDFLLYTSPLIHYKFESHHSSKLYHTLDSEDSTSLSTTLW